MANEKNLKPIRSKKLARELGAKGGKAKAENERKRKTLKENMNLLLGLEVTTPEDFNKLAALGIPMEDIDNSMLLTAALFLKAKSGDVAACKEIRSWVDEDHGQADTGLMAALLQVMEGKDNGV